MKIRSIVILTIISFLVIGNSVVIADKVKVEHDKTVCMDHLRKIGEAIKAYRADHNNEVPDWLSDLYPKYLRDKKLLLCPVDKKGIPIGWEQYKDPKMPCSYLYEFNPYKYTYYVGFDANPPKDMTWKEGKTREMKYFGGTVPIVRCRYHEKKVLNLSYDGRIYFSGDGWGYEPEAIKAVKSNLQKTIERNPDGWEKEIPISNLYSYFYERGKEHEFKAFLEKQKNLSVDSLEYLEGFYYDEGNFEKLIDTIQRELRLPPKNPDSHIDLRLWLARLYARTGKYKEAREQCQKVIKLKPDNAEVYGILAELDALQDGKRIKDHLTKAPAGDPELHYLAKLEELLLAQKDNIKSNVDKMHTIAQSSFGEPTAVTKLVGLYQKLGKSLSKTQGQWRTYGSADGLINNWVGSMAQDKNGILWIGTGAGVCLFDGEIFTPFSSLFAETEKQKGSELEKLSKASVTSMLIDKQGDFWFGTNEHGVFQYDGKKLMHYTKENGLGGGTIQKIIQDKKGNIWFASIDSLTRYDGKEFKNFTESDGLSSSYIYSVLEDHKGMLWIIGDGVTKYDGEKFIKLTEKDGFKQEYSRWGWDIIEDSKGNIWFSSNMGICKYDGKSFKYFTGKEGIYSNPFDIMEDRQGNIWFCYTYSVGVMCYDGKKFTTYTDKDGLAGNMLKCIFEDREGNIWFGHDAGRGLTKYTPQGMKIYGIEDGLAGNNVSSISEDKNGNLWIAMDRGLCMYDGKAFTQPFRDSRWSLGPIWHIMSDSKGNLWFTTSYDFSSNEYVPQNEQGIIKYDGKSFRHFTTADGLSINQISCAIEDRNGNIWMTTGNGKYGRGIIKYDGKSFISFTTADELTNDDTTYLDEDLQGNIWIGTWGGGVSKYDGKKFTNFREVDGLVNNYVYSVFADSKGRIWIGTMNGLSTYDGKSFTTIPQLSNRFILRVIEDRSGYLWFGTNDGVFKTDGKVFTQITTADGIPNSVVNCICEDKNGDIWVGTRQGIARYKPNLTQPSIQIESIKADKVYPTTKADKIYPYFEAISLPTKTEYFKVNYRGVSFRTRPGAMQYLYQLEEYDKDWQGPIKERSVDYINVKPGKYIFKVKAVGIDLNYSEPVSVEINIQYPPFYTSAGFIGGSIFAAFLIPSIIYASILTRQKRKQAFETISNPYIVGNPIRSGDMFFGREDDFRFVQAKLGTGETGIAIVFAGERRSGKTSILFQILNGRLGDQFVPILLDMQAMTVDNEVEFFEKIASEINSALDERINIPTNAFRDGNPTRPFEKFIADVMATLGSKSLLFLFDEYELIETKIDDGILRSDIITFFASLLEKHTKLSFIFTGSRHLEQRNPRYWNILIGKSIYRKISFLSELDTMRLIKEPVKGSVVYPKGIPERIYRLTSGQPFYTQVVCQSLVDRLNAEQRNRVMQDDIDAVSQELAENPLPQMIYFWDGLERNQRIALSLLGEVLGDSIRYVSAKAMLGFATEHDLDFGIELTEMERMLDDLFTHDVLERERVGDGNYEYRFRVDLFRIWIRQSQSIWQSG